MSTIGRDSARAEAQQAFVGLLATPLLVLAVVFAGSKMHGHRGMQEALEITLD